MTRANPQARRTEDTSRLREIGSSAETSQKIVVRYLDGRVIRAYIPKGAESGAHGVVGESLTVQGADGNSVRIDANEIKAVFLVRSFDGNPNYQEYKAFYNPPSGRGVWVRVHFQDGEVLEGVAPNCFDTYSKPIFYMTPPDPSSNNEAVLVSKHFVKDMQILGLASE